ncbi:MAG: bacteriohemerythrin [Cyclobacteriaceae bacterium]|nr:bacteriohemerythrin [Cyclobacteriaceae bacterium]
MNFIDWNDSYSVGIRAIDNQHKGLVDLVNQLYNSMREGKERAILEDIIEKLVQYTQIHFTYEEAFFKKFGYEKTDEHTREHQEFIDEIIAFKRKFNRNKGEGALSIEMLQFLSGWLFAHIKGADRDYIKCFHDHGLK